MIGVGVVLAGRYRLDRHIASGGMGDVWQGFDEVLGRTVAVKCLRAQSDDPTFVARFQAEARIMATISHPAVVEVYDFGDDPAVGVYLVMKYIEGDSLANALIREGRLGTDVTLRLIAEAAEALHAAHEKGITHRDVKPGNLLVRPDGSVVLTDFGIARSEGAVGHTLTGSLIGTAGYIAPERAAGQPATARSDIYSLGVVAYRCLAGRLPFEGDSLVELALRHAHDAPPPLPPDVPQNVQAIVDQALAKNPADRWPSGAALAAAARRASNSTTAQPTVAAVPLPKPPARRRTLVVGLATVVALIVAVVAVLSAMDHRAPSDSAAADPRAPSAPAGTGITSPSAGLGRTSPTAGPSASNATPSAAATTLAAGATKTPAAPTSLQATPVSASMIRLRWKDSSSNETGFTIQTGATSREAGANATSFDWTGLAPDTYMCFKVRAHNASGPSAYYPAAQKDWICATSLAGTGPAAPSNLSATPVNSGAIRLQWTDNSDNEAGFTVQNGTTSRNVGADATAYDWTGLAPGTYMCFKVRSRNASGVSAYFPAAQSDWVCTQTPAT